MNKITMLGIVAVICVSVFSVSCGKKEDLKKMPPERFFKDPALIELCRAMSAKDAVKVDKLLDKGLALNTVGKEGMTPLLWTIWRKDIKMYEKLLKKGADPNIEIVFRNSKTSVMSLVCMAKDNDYLEVTLKYTKRKLNMKIDTDALRSAIGSEIYPVPFKKVKKIVAAGANLNQLDSKHGKPPIISAGVLNQWHIVYYLLQAGADPLKPDVRGQTIVQLIEKRNRLVDRKHELYQYLLKCAKFLNDKGIKVDVSKPPMTRAELRKRLAEQRELRARNAKKYDEEQQKLRSKPVL